MDFIYDVIVVGAGHAGCEAASASANLGSKTLLITMDMNKIGQMSCNPAIGGIAKGQIVREIDALGGQLGIIADETSIQFRMLNKSKGAAMWSPRTQNDRRKFIDSWIHKLSNTDNLYLWQDNVISLLVRNNTVCGVKTALGLEIKSRCVVLTNGTFLNGKLHFGNIQMSGGRISEPAAFGLTEHLKSLGFQSDRMKTGTPCRIDKRSIDFSVLEEQKGDNDFHHFSFLPVEKRLKQMSCWITYTNPNTHDILRKNLDKSPLYNGQIKSIGPRYCPSIETKIVTFSDKDSHQLYIEPEGENSNEYYLNGFSSSLPLQVQLEALKTVKGLENIVIYRPGYAIEYDFFQPTQLHHSLETKLINNLFFAGQINGTTGYEEAAGQGIIAGINAHQKANNLPEFTLNRNDAYIGVLIDDLVNKGVDEPYRMFTSRAEFRILLRQDNADERLTPLSHKLGLASEERLRNLESKIYTENLLEEYIKSNTITPIEINGYLNKIGSQLIDNNTSIYNILRRPSTVFSDIIKFNDRLQLFVDNLNVSDEIIENLDIKIKYQGYIKREYIAAEKIERLQNIVIPKNIQYNSILSLSTEARQKLSLVKPKTINDAKKIPGVSPNDINILIALIRK